MSARVAILLAVVLAAIACGIRAPPEPPQPPFEPGRADAGWIAADAGTR